MAKTKTTFFCQNCGNQSPKWEGKCSACNEWNTYIEETVQPQNKSQHTNLSFETKKPEAHKIEEIAVNQQNRISIPDKELNRVLGNGLVTGSITLFGGEPGIGKSTLMLQLALQLAPKKVLYVSGEESEQQIKMRASRIGSSNTNCYVLSETFTSNIFQQIKKIEPELIIIDSIQTLHSPSIESSPGSISQIRECTSELLKFAKQTNTPIFLIGHITKEGSIAGPKVLEHMVDTVLQFEGDRNHVYRLLRTSKNRFGSTNELGIYEMQGSGLREVSNPSEILITNREEELSGIATAATIEGMRPMLIEIQALVSSAAYGTPQRSSTGFDTKRLNMLLAVLEKRCGFRLGAKDVFLNIAGGIKVDDPAIDLAVVCSVLSSSEDIFVDPNTCFAGEVGLSGEIRAVNRVEQRILEAEKLGFNSIFISSYNAKSIAQKNFNIELIPVKKIENVFQLLFG